jgi:hypothetical protein
MAFRMPSGRPWYRYVGYRNQMPQAQNAGRIQFRALNQDLDNRWTGYDPEGRGRQGLYFSEEFLNAGDPFPELTHYQQGPDADSRGLVSYYRYAQGLEPTLEVAETTNLRSMFLFNQTRDMRGLDLRLMVDGGINPLLAEIHRTAQADPNFENLNAQAQDLDLNDLQAVYAADRAEFCRAVGNEGFALDEVEFLRVSSARALNVNNIVARTPNYDGVGERPVLDGLAPQGRATFFVDAGGRVGQSAFTISDLVYNAIFEDPAVPARGLPPVDEVVARLTEVQQTTVDTLANRLRPILEIHPGSSALDGVAEAVGNLQAQMVAGADPAEISTGIANLRTAITAAGEPDINAFKDALRLSESVAGTVETINDAVRNMQEQDVDPPEVIDDPDPSDLDPDVGPVEGASGND